jgi:hypothetical protein
MSRLILVASLISPLLTLAAPRPKRSRLTTAVLFILTVVACLCAPSTAFDTAFPSGGIRVAFHPALLHPVLLAGAFTSGCGVGDSGPSPLVGEIPVKSAVAALFLGLPMATWLTADSALPWAFLLGAYVTAGYGVWATVALGALRTAR